MKWQYEKICMESGMSSEKIRELRKIFDADKKRLKRENQHMENGKMFCVTISSLSEESMFEIPDSMDVADVAIKNFYMEKLAECLAKIDEDDRELLLTYFDKSINFSKYAKSCGELRENLIYRVESLVKTLRKMMEI